MHDMPVERLYREIRALRIYEGATEVQQLIIARDLLREAAGTDQTTRSSATRG
jgi:alkylation response protein AidB-like acyl-CoA dehydrogenase